jgi:hypothetical protein
VSPRRFPPPLSVDEQEVCFIVRDANRHALALRLFRGRTRSALSGEAAHQGRGPAAGGELRQAAGAAAAGRLKHCRTSSLKGCKQLPLVQRPHPSVAAQRATSMVPQRDPRYTADWAAALVEDNARRAATEAPWAERKQRARRRGGGPTCRAFTDEVDFRRSIPTDASGCCLRPVVSSGPVFMTAGSPTGQRGEWNNSPEPAADLRRRGGQYPALWPRYLRVAHTLGLGPLANSEVGR